MKKIFKSADFLLPKKDIALEKWAVVACDQHTSNLAFWKEAQEIVGDSPSTLSLIFPEVYLEDADFHQRIDAIHASMDKYVGDGLFDKVEDSLIFVERKQMDGRLRCGVVGVVDLEEYDFKPNSKSLIRPTEGTIEDRIPPRLHVREKARLELSHVMVLVDDPSCEVIEALRYKLVPQQMLYSIELMQQGGSIKGFKLSEEQKQHVINSIANIVANSPLALAMGDGNHSLATAKTHWDNLKKGLPQNELENHPARYAMVEVVNLHSPALTFEPIHRVMMGVDKNNVLAELKKSGMDKTDVAALQVFIDAYIEKHGGTVDYIHGADATIELGAKEGNVEFLLPVIDKHDLFPAIIKGGALPRKSFSMGDSIHGKQEDKRYYIEAREIVK